MIWFTHAGLISAVIAFWMRDQVRFKMRGCSGASRQSVYQHHLEHLQLNLSTFQLGIMGFGRSILTLYYWLNYRSYYATVFRYVAVSMQTGVPGKCKIL